MGVLSAPGWRKTFAGPSLQGGHGTVGGCPGYPPLHGQGRFPDPPVERLSEDNLWVRRKSCCFLLHCFAPEGLWNCRPIFEQNVIWKWSKRILDDFWRSKNPSFRSFAPAKYWSRCVWTVFAGPQNFSSPPKMLKKKWAKSLKTIWNGFYFHFEVPQNIPQKFRPVKKWWERRKIRIFPTGFFFTFSSLV